MATPKDEEQPRESRWSARKKGDAVIRLLRGGSLDEVSRELRVEAHRLQAWRDGAKPTRPQRRTTPRDG